MADFMKKTTYGHNLPRHDEGDTTAIPGKLDRNGALALIPNAGLALFRLTGPLFPIPSPVGGFAGFPNQFA